MAAWDLLFRRVHLATFAGDEPYGMLRDGALAVRAGRIVWLGAERDLPREARAAQEIDGAGRWLLPGLIDCHTHLVHAGNRAQEFELRLQGASYEEIARAGGGIRATVAATRAADEEALVAASRPRLDRLIAEGVTTVEIKSGYGLELSAERRMLRAARTLGDTAPVRVTTTFLGAHALPPEYDGRADDYIAEVCDVMLPALFREGLVDAVDAFCEHIAFSPAQTEAVFRAARALRLPVRVHAEQLSDSGGGAALAARYGALCADHLEHLSDTGAAALAAAGSVAVLLPGAFYFLRETQLPPVARLRALGVPIAIATDCNPGTSPLSSLLLALNMACVLFRLAPAEALAGVTRNAARALGRVSDLGTLEAGKLADLGLWNVDAPVELCYHLGYNPLALRMFGGQISGAGDVAQG
ncbi:imidazolonepropionase [Aromatoleum buckelii]|uniref:Imidazolonepropionase n=1 Tax=Aromatoleum buckelii TaxID=200254 RepID=A0ABX1N3Y9_9RHOO|nr:imidazolonepropionase [Aromatoleum buckelii]MCK0511519.1 imidazolonepropionase [Aromatoleum buckelii]